MARLRQQLMAFARRGFGQMLGQEVAVMASRIGGRTAAASMPTDDHGRPRFFDRLATAVSRVVSRAYFFAFCAGLVVAWLPSYFLFESVETWQLPINTVTTIITFLLVALLENSQTRSDTAAQDKLNAIAAALHDLIDCIADDTPTARRIKEELHQAVGLEDHTTTEK
jgi:low affinity Fe/Cu permease